MGSAKLDDDGTTHDFDMVIILCISMSLLRIYAVSWRVPGPAPVLSQYRGGVPPHYLHSPLTYSVFLVFLFGPSRKPQVEAGVCNEIPHNDFPVPPCNKYPWSHFYQAILSSGGVSFYLFGFAGYHIFESQFYPFWCSDGSGTLRSIRFASDECASVVFDRRSSPVSARAACQANEAAGRRSTTSTSTRPCGYPKSEFDARLPCLRPEPSLHQKG